MTGQPLPHPRIPVRRPVAPAPGLATVTRLDPPGETRETVPVATVQGTLALDLGLLPAQPRVPDLRVVPGPASTEHREVQAWAARFAQATVEVLGGDRPVAQLLRWTTARVYQDLDRRVRILGRTAAAPGGSARSELRCAACTSSNPRRPARRSACTCVTATGPARSPPGWRSATPAGAAWRSSSG